MKINYNNEISILTQRDLIEAGCFDVNKVIEICENILIEYVAGNVIFPDKISAIFDERTQNRINCLVAGIPKEKVYGMKWVSVFPENPHRHNRPNLSALILLSELESGFPVAIMEGSLCSNLRTAAIGAVAAKYFARKNSETIGFIGAGEQAKSHFLSMKAVCPKIKCCKVSSRTKESEKMFISQMERYHPDVKFIACDGNYEHAVKEADIIVTAISGQEKLLKAEWIKKGTFYCHVGGLEDEYAVPLKADKIICDDWEVVKHRTQTLSRMYKEGILKDSDIYANLPEVITGKKTARNSEEEFIYFNSVGLSFLDVAVANWMYNKTKALNAGKTIVLQEQSMFDYNNKTGEVLR